MARQHRVVEKIKGLSDPDTIRRFEQKLRRKYTLTRLDLTQNHFRFRARLNLSCEPKIPVHLQIFSTDTIQIMGSPQIPQVGFESETAEILEIAVQSLRTEPAPDETPLKLRSRALYDYLKELDIDDDIPRIVVVTLGDLIIDLLLSNKLEELKLPRRQLDQYLDQYLPGKIQSLKDNGEIVYRELDIDRLHRLRNKIAHGSSLITRDEAEWAITLVEDIIEHI